MVTVFGYFELLTLVKMVKILVVFLFNIYGKNFHYLCFFVCLLVLDLLLDLWIVVFTVM